MKSSNISGKNIGDSIFSQEYKYNNAELSADDYYYFESEREKAIDEYYEDLERKKSGIISVTKELLEERRKKYQEAEDGELRYYEDLEKEQHDLYYERLENKYVGNKL